MPDLGSHLQEWPVNQVVKCLCFYHPNDPAELKQRQERELLRLADAARTVGREFLVEIIAGKHGPLEDDTVASVVRRLYDLGIKPDWWKLEPQRNAAAWKRIEEAIAQNDPYCRGIVLLGLDAPENELFEAFRAVADAPMVKGFAVGRTIFGDAARRWLKARSTTRRPSPIWRTASRRSSRPGHPPGLRLPPEPDDPTPSGENENDPYRRKPDLLEQ